MQAHILCGLIGTWALMSTMSWAGEPLTTADLPAVDELPSRPELPDPFIRFDGSRVATPAEWVELRRPELKLLFQHYMYGYLPAPAKIEAKVTQQVTGLLGGKATLKEVEISFPELPAEAPRIHLALFLPAKADKPVPVFLALNKCGNHTVVTDERVRIDETAWCHKNCGPDPQQKRGEKSDFWCVDYIVSRGYAFATFHESNIDPDQHDFSDGIHPYYPHLPGPPTARWGTIAAWAWGLQRCVDYLVTDADIDSKAIAITGHSRRGKTALLASALDERVALAVPHQSGTGGTAISRNNDQETIERINRVFPHWFSDTFAEFNDREDRLPVDQHLLIALMAPRPMLETSGLQDTWANYVSSFQAIQQADRVYRFLGAPGLKLGRPATADDDLSDPQIGNLAQCRLDTKHTLNQDYWKVILDFADRQYGRR